MAKGINIFNSSDVNSIKKAQEIYKKYSEATTGFKVSLGKNQPSDKNAVWFDTTDYEKANS